MRITRYPLNGAGARKRDPISDPLSLLSLPLSADDPRSSRHLGLREKRRERTRGEVGSFPVRSVGALRRGGRMDFV